MYRIRALGTAAVVALLVAACNGASSSTATPSSSVAGATATPMTTPSSSPSAMASSSAGAGASLALPSLAMPSMNLNMHADPSLEAMLPASLGGHPLQKLSFSFAELSSLGVGSSNDATFFGWLKALGKSPSDASMAVASDAAGGGPTISALQVKGTSQDQLLTTFVAASQTQQMAPSQVTLSGKQVTKLSSSTGPAMYAYAKDDVLYLVQAPDDNTASQAFAALP